MVVSNVVHIVEELEYTSLSRVVERCNDASLCSRKDLEVHLRNVVHAANKDTCTGVVDTDVLLTFLHNHFCSVGCQSEVVAVQYIVNGVRCNRPIALLLSLSSGQEEFVVGLCENKRSCKEKRLFSRLRELVNSSLVKVGYILDIGAKAVLHVQGWSSLDGALQPALTAKGTPCADCVWSIKTYGRRCWRKSHHDQKAGVDRLEGQSYATSLKPALTRKGLPCCDCVTAIVKGNRRCWRKAHQVQE
jgi:hypothetical protein